MSEHSRHGASDKIIMTINLLSSFSLIHNKLDPIGRRIEPLHLAANLGAILI